MATKQHIITDRELFSFLRELVLSVQKNRKTARKTKKVKATKKRAVKKKTVRVSTKPAQKSKKTTKKRISYRYLSSGQDITGISSTNIGETQHTESPKSNLFGHIPRSTPAPNVSGSNAYSSMQAQHPKKEAPKEKIAFKAEVRVIKKPGKYRKFSHKKQRDAYSGMQSLIHKPDSSALDYGGSLGPMSDKHEHREKNKQKKFRS